MQGEWTWQTNSENGHGNTEKLPVSYYVWPRDAVPNIGAATVSVWGGWDPSMNVHVKEGDKVLRRNMKQKTRKGSKGEDRWLGPYTIVELSATTCILKNALGKKLKTRINRSQLKPYLQTSQSDNKHANPTESDSELTCQSEPDKPSDYESENET